MAALPCPCALLVATAYCSRTLPMYCPCVALHHWINLLQAVLLSRTRQRAGLFAGLAYVPRFLIVDEGALIACPLGPGSLGLQGTGAGACPQQAWESQHQKLLLSMCPEAKQYPAQHTSVGPQQL